MSESVEIEKDIGKLTIERFKDGVMVNFLATVDGTMDVVNVGMNSMTIENLAKRASREKFS